MVRFEDPARPTAAELKRWQAGYRRAEARQNAIRSLRGFDRRRAVRDAQALFDLTPPVATRATAQASVRQREVDRGRAIWRRLRQDFVARQRRSLPGSGAFPSPWLR